MLRGYQLVMPCSFHLNPIARLKTILQECEESLLGFERLPPRRLIDEMQWKPDARSNYCSECGRSDHPADRCGLATRETESSYASVIRLGAYADPLATWIRELKFARWEVMGVQLGRLLGEACRDEFRRQDIRIHAVVPTPMPMFRRSMRGIDHVHVIARAAAGVLKCPMKYPVGQRGGPPQSGRGVNERRQRSRVFFSRRWGKPVNGENILLLDDVLTTGATARSLCRILKAQGARSIALGVVAVAEISKKQLSKDRKAIY